MSRPTGPFKAFRDSTGRLHAKTAVIDQQKVFFGSMNFDPRSESVNTELGVFADSHVRRLYAGRTVVIDAEADPLADGFSAEIPLGWRFVVRYG